MDIKGRNFLKLLDFTPEEINGLVELAARLKADKKAGREKQMLKGKNIVLLFEKDSTRTRCAFEVGAYDQGAQVTYLGPTGSQMGKKESIADTARVLGRMYDGIEYRGYGQDIVEDLAKYAGVVVWNGLTTEFADTCRLAHHEGALRQAFQGDEVLLPGRCAQQHGQLADGRLRQDGYRFPCRMPQELRSVG